MQASGELRARGKGELGWRWLGLTASGVHGGCDSSCLQSAKACIKDLCKHGAQKGLQKQSSQDSIIILYKCPGMVDTCFKIVKEKLDACWGR